VRIVGAGRAGSSFAAALNAVGWGVTDVLGRGDDLTHAGVGVDLVLIATPDAAIEGVAAAIEPTDAVVAHVAGSLGLDVLAPHRRRAALHPLLSLPTADLGARRLLAGGWFAVAGDALVARAVEDLGGRSFVVADADRALYHAAACIASNHVVALLGQVERLADDVGVPLEAFLDLTRGSVDAVAELGAEAALTGPAARGDEETIARHLAALAPGERAVYEALVAEARRLAAGRADRTDGNSAAAPTG
jgi:predicted short-subunit dehydrogenase-like oxidoreductase (DUF2520 family)